MASASAGVWDALVDVCGYAACTRALTPAAHCHPTEVLLRGDMEHKTWLCAAADVPLRAYCAMSTGPEDQHLVAGLARDVGAKVIPAFGIHPWLAHRISLRHPAPGAREHYSALFDARADRTALYDALPAPVSLRDVLTQMDALLDEFPRALVGEVGLDRSFRIPHPACGGNAERARTQRLSPLQTPLAHQLAVLDAQVQLACRSRRSVSMHSVRAAGATMSFLDTFAQMQGGRDIGLLLHSCTLSPESIKQVQRLHGNVFVSFSLTINARQPSLHAQVQASERSRVLCESDYDAPHELAARTRAAAELLGHGEKAHDTAARLTRNFDTYHRYGTHRTG
ncbi:Cut9-interacting protein scn1 [Malassezia sp. CBS 17886]|nr:Cut9-interacting protein scn1 [Malassezia sp. CBS 17886]